MKNAITFMLLMLVFGCQAQKKTSGFEWNLKKEKIHNENRNDPSKWSAKTWKSDTQNIVIQGDPMTNGVYPVPKYELTDPTFEGVGNSGNWLGFDLKGKKIIHHSLYVKKNAVNKAFIKDKPDEVFFTIVVLTDSVDLQGYSHTNVGISSRNHPHYAGQGFVKTKTNKVDFVAFLTADRNNYAMINMRLFDLRIGRIVLIAPQKDATLRSLQLNAPIMAAQEMDQYIENVLSKDQKVIEFFTKSDNI